MGRNAAIRKFFSDLAEAEIVYRDLSSQADAGRTGAALVLKAVVDLVENIGADPRLKVPAFALVTALIELGEGRVSEMLRPEKKAHAPGLKQTDRVQRAHAALAMTLFMKAGEGRESAASLVARRITDWPVTQKCGAGLLWKQVARWRDEAAAGGDETDAVLYRAGLRRLPEIDDHRAAAERLLLRKQFTLLSIFPGKGGS